MEKQWHIFGLGAIAVDDLLLVDHYPGPDEKVQVTTCQRQGGGLTATALVTAARHGSRTLLCGVLGCDELSQSALEELQHEGVDCSAILRAPEARPYHSTVIVDSAAGSRTILSCSERVTLPDRDAIRAEWIAGSLLAFVDHTAGDRAVHVLDLAHSYGLPVVADIEDAHAPHLARLLAGIDHLIVSSQFARRVTGQQHEEDMVRALAGPARAACVVTAGARGAWYAERGGAVTHCPAFEVRVMDTTGCGDVFHGAYTAALARGETVQRAVQVATVTASLKATRMGGRAGIPDLATVERLLAAPGSGVGRCA